MVAPHRRQACINSVSPSLLTQRADSPEHTNCLFYNRSLSCWLMQQSTTWGLRQYVNSALGGVCC